MKNKLKYLVIVLFALSCSKNDDAINVNSQAYDHSFQYLNKYKKIINWITYKEDTTDTREIFEYYLDDLGRVYKSKLKNFLGVPGWDYEKKFIYDKYNRLTEVYRNGALLMKFVWNRDTVRLYDNKNIFHEKFVYNKERLINSGNKNYVYFDNSHNLSSVWNGNNLQSEYFEYDYNVINPLFYLKSIELSFLWETTRIMSFGPISKNIHYKQKDQPINGGDYFIPLRTYDYLYFLDEKNRVAHSENEKAIIYSWHYKYIP